MNTTHKEKYYRGRPEIGRDKNNEQKQKMQNKTPWFKAEVEQKCKGRMEAFLVESKEQK